MGQIFLNNARAILASNITATNTVIEVKTPVNLPAQGFLGTNDYFLLTIFSNGVRYDDNLEVIKVTAVNNISASTNVNLTVERGFEFTAQSHPADTRLEARLTAQSLKDVISGLESYTDQQITDLVGGAPGALDTLNELAAALNDNDSFSTWVTNQLATKLDASTYTASDILSKLITVDGDGSGLNADTLDNKQANEFVDLQADETRKRLDRETTLKADFVTENFVLYQGISDGMVSVPYETMFNHNRTSTATGFAPNGVLATAAIDRKRSVYDPATGKPEGLLIEEQRTNVLLDNRDLSTGNWGVSGITLTQDQTGLDGIVNKAWTITSSSVNSSDRLKQDTTISDDSQTHVLHVFIKKTSTSSLIRIENRLIGGSIEVASKIDFDPNNDTANSNADITDAGDWWLVEVAATNNSSGNTLLRFRIFPDLDGNGNSCVYDFGQVELNTDTASSPIETNGSQVTRAADKVTRMLGNEFNNAAFSVVVRLKLPSSNNEDVIMVSYTEGTFFSTANRVWIGKENNDLSVTITTNSNNQAILLEPISNTGNPGDIVTIAVRIEENNFAIAANGAIQVTNISGVVPKLDRMTVGGRTTADRVLNSTILFVREFNRELTDAELTALTTVEN